MSKITISWNSKGDQYSISEYEVEEGYYLYCALMQFMNILANTRAPVQKIDINSSFVEKEKDEK